MAPAPLCKTAIVTFLIDKETLPKLWNLSSNMRKRLQMILEQMDFAVREYNENIFKIKEQVKITNQFANINSTEGIKKGVSNYVLRTQEQLDSVITLNGKLRCYSLCFKLETPVAVECIGDLEIDSYNYDFYSKCSFNTIRYLRLVGLSSSQIKEIITTLKQVKTFEIKDSSISDLDLSSLSISSLQFEYVTFLGSVKLPSSFYSLHIIACSNAHLLKCNQILSIQMYQRTQNDSLAWIKRVKRLKRVYINSPLSKLLNCLPNTVRTIGNGMDLDFKNIDLSLINKKFPFLIEANNSIPIEAAQTFNLRNINPIMSATEEKFTFRPREIKVNEKNVEQLNNHPELLERVEKIWIYTDKFNFDCLSVGVKTIEFYPFSIQGEKLQSLEKNNWKFEESVVDVSLMEEDEVRKILDSLKKVKKVEVSWYSELDKKDYPQFRFIYS